MNVAGSIEVYFMMGFLIVSDSLSIHVFLSYRQGPYGVASAAGRTATRVKHSKMSGSRYKKASLSIISEGDELTKLQVGLLVEFLN